MKTPAKWFALGVLAVCVIGATFKRIGDLPISTNPTANAWLEIDDLSANPRSSRYQLSRLATSTALSAALSGKQNAAANLNDWANVSTNVLGSFLLLSGGTLTGNLTVDADVDVTGVVTVTGGAGASTFEEVTVTNRYNKEAQTGISFTLDVANSDGTTNRLVIVGGVVVSNIANHF